MELTDGIGVDAALECVGTGQSIATAAAIARPGSMVGIVGVPHGEVPFDETFFRNVGWQRRCRPGPDLHPRAARTTCSPGRSTPACVFDYETDLDADRRRVQRRWTSGAPSSR